MRQPKLQCVIWKEGKYFVARCLNVEVSSFGKTKREASANLLEALELYFQDATQPAVPKIEQPELVRFDAECCYA